LRLAGIARSVGDRPVGELREELRELSAGRPEALT
jgi:hypothetical protein